MSIVASDHREFWIEFIRLYKSFPELWNTSDENYKSRPAKSIAYNKLAKKLLEIDKNATQDVVKRKINSLRASYRREMLKVIASEKCAEDSDNVYRPTLWCYLEMDFLRTQEDKNESKIADVHEIVEDSNDNDSVQMISQFNVSFGTFDIKVSELFKNYF
jgi:hypothetical protein